MFDALCERHGVAICDSLDDLVETGRLLAVSPRPRGQRAACLVFSGLTLICAFSEWQDFDMLHVAEADDKWHFLSRILGRPILVIDHLSAPLLPLTQTDTTL